MLHSNLNQETQSYHQLSEAQGSQAAKTSEASKASKSASSVISFPGAHSSANPSRSPMYLLVLICQARIFTFVRHPQKMKLPVFMSRHANQVDAKPVLALLCGKRSQGRLRQQNAALERASRRLGLKGLYELPAIFLVHPQDTDPEWDFKRGHNAFRTMVIVDMALLTSILIACL